MVELSPSPDWESPALTHLETALEDDGTNPESSARTGRLPGGDVVTANAFEDVAVWNARVSRRASIWCATTACWRTSTSYARC
jgi:hypothetical protein